jgi:hypothetical protein
MGSAMIAPLFGAQDDEWVAMVGRYILNMGAVELATRLIIGRIAGTDQVQVSVSLAARLAYIRKRIPREDNNLHMRAIKILSVADRNRGFSNVVAHSPVAITGHSDGTFTIHGIMNIAPLNKANAAELVSLEELRGRVNESAALARDMLEMQSVFPVFSGG